MDKQDKPEINPIEDQRKEALRHYEEAARLANYWSSFVRDAILAYNPVSKQDKTAEDYLQSIDIWHHPIIENRNRSRGYEVAELIESYAQHRTAELEAKIKALEDDLLDALDLKEGKGPTALSMLSARVKALEERLEAADEVIAYTEKINFYATHGDVKREYDEALAKYQSLKK